MWEVRRLRRHMNHANQVVSTFGERLRRQHGFLADPSLPTWRNVVRRIRELSVDDYVASNVGNLACHNLLRYFPLPAGTTKLLGLGLNYCIKPSSVTTTTKSTIRRMQEDVRRLYHLRVDAGDGSEYIKSLYIKSDYKFDHASDEIEEAIKEFERELRNEQLSINRRRKPLRNITNRQWKLILFFKDNDLYIVVQGDKNLGPCILDRKYYILRGCTEHLSNTSNYRQLSRAQADALQRGLMYRFWSWFNKYSPPTEHQPPKDWVCFSDAEVTFLGRAGRRNPDKIARFRMTAKVHKDPWKCRPIVCCAGTVINDVSKWLDYWLQKLKCHVPTYIKDSQQVLNEIANLNIPPGASLFTTDANAMYNNIDTDHAIQVLTWWLDDLNSRGRLPLFFPLDAVREAMVLVMRNNIFEFGDICFLQLLGTAMGTSAAVMWATLYYAYHEVHTILPKYGDCLPYFKRFIDDIFGVWTGTAQQWSDFCTDIDNFGQLRWDIKTQKLSSSVDFLDLTLTIEGSRIISKTFQKRMNLYLYIPPASAHTAGCIKGTIFGLVRRYYAHNTYQKDFVYFVRLLYRRLLHRGWQRELIRPMILDACNIVQRNNPSNTPTVQPETGAQDEDNLLFLHLTYHPDDISRKRLRELYEKHLGDIFRRELNIDRPIIAYSRPKNIGDYVTKAKLHQAPDQSSSTIMGRHRNGLDPL